MKNEKVITRTIVSITVTVLGLDIETALSSTKTFVIGDVDNEKDALKIITAICENDTFKPVKVVTLDREENLYGMPESIFLKYAKKLPPRKVYEKTETPS